MPTINYPTSDLSKATDELGIQNFQEHYQLPYLLSHMSGLKGQELEDLIMEIRKRQYLQQMIDAQRAYQENRQIRTEEDYSNFPGMWKRKPKYGPLGRRM